MTSLTDLYCKHADTVFPPGNVQDAIDEWAVRRIQKLEADNAALREALFGLYANAGLPMSDIEPDQLNDALDEARAVLFNDHPGADLLRESDELRAEVETIRKNRDRCRKNLQIEIERRQDSDGEVERLQAEVERSRRLLSGAVVYDTGAAVSERAIHKRLVEMGWTPPEEQNV